MDFFLEIYNGECGLGGLFCDHQRDHGPSVLIQKRQSFQFSVYLLNFQLKNCYHTMIRRQKTKFSLFFIPEGG